MEARDPGGSASVAAHKLGPLQLGAAGSELQCLPVQFPHPALEAEARTESQHQARCRTLSPPRGHTRALLFGSLPGACAPPTPSPIPNLEFPPPPLNITWKTSVLPQPREPPPPTLHCPPASQASTLVLRAPQGLNLPADTPASNGTRCQNLTPVGKSSN